MERYKVDYWQDPLRDSLNSLKAHTRLCVSMCIYDKLYYSLEEIAKLKDNLPLGECCYCYMAYQI